MDQKELTEQLIKIVSETINAIANGKYDELEHLLMLGSSRYGEDGDFSSALSDFRDAIEINYQGWAEDEGKEFRIAGFTPKNTSDDFSEIAHELLEGSGEEVLSYDLKTTDDDPDYFFLEFSFALKNVKIETTLNLNI